MKINLEMCTGNMYCVMMYITGIEQCEVRSRGPRQHTSLRQYKVEIYCIPIKSERLRNMEKMLQDDRHNDIVFIRSLHGNSAKCCFTIRSSGVDNY